MYNENDLKEFRQSLRELPADYLQIGRDWTSVKLDEETTSYALHGFLRRTATIMRCIDQIFNTCPPEADRMGNEELDDTIIFIQAFIFNIFGAIDNLAHIMNSHFSLNVARNKIGFAPANKFASFRQLLSPNFQNKLKEYDDRGWFAYLIDYRHSLAHRIPLYIPPTVMNKADLPKYNELSSLWTEAILKHEFDKADKIEQERQELGKFVPLIGHSFYEDHHRIAFHKQLLSDWEVLKDLSKTAIEEVKAKSKE